MQSCVALWLVAAGLLGMEETEGQLHRFQFARTEMAVPITIVIYSRDEEIANRAAGAAFDRIHELNAILSDYDRESEVRRLCSSPSAGKGVRLCDDLWRVLAHAQDLSARTDGAFDITVGPVVRLWRRARQLKELPSQEALKKALARTGYRAVRLDAEKHEARLLKPDMLLDLGGVAKGYALDEAYAALKRNGVERAMIEAGGDIRLGESPPDRPGWRIGIGQTEAKGAPRSYISISRAAAATSGDLWQFVEIGEKRYSHIVDPRTGIGLTERIEVTVVAADGMRADGLSTAVSVLGLDKGLKLIEGTPGAAAYILRMGGEKVEVYESKRWEALRDER